MVGWVKYGPDCWMIEGDGKCRAEAEARGLPANTNVYVRNKPGYPRYTYCTSGGERCAGEKPNIKV